MQNVELRSWRKNGFLLNPHTLIPVTQNGKEVERLCVKMAEEGYSKWDIFLAKVLLLKTDEHQFLRTANHICK
jgi:hypothetical protein